MNIKKIMEKKFIMNLNKKLFMLKAKVKSNSKKNNFINQIKIKKV